MDSTRIEFLARGGFDAGAARSSTPVSGGVTAFRYKIEVSIDGKSYSAVLDKIEQQPDLDGLAPQTAVRPG